jgi:FKBP-type peptidyl-prolyl cis-trans isomerase FklB
MKEGDKWQLFIPTELAYGARGSGAKIAPHSALIFEIELLKVN